MVSSLVRCLVLAVAITCSATAVASALPPEGCDPDCGSGGGGPVVTTFNPDLFVASTNGGTIQDSPQANINCGLDCSQGGLTYSYSRSCEDSICDYSGVDTVTLVASGGPSGFSPTWLQCQANVGSGGACANATRSACDQLVGASCQINMYDDTRVELTWIDTTDPNTSFQSPRGVVGPTATGFTATGTDNASVEQMRFAIDGIFVAADTTKGNGFTFDVSPTAYADGSSHTLTAQAVDSSNRLDPTPASTSFTVDRSTQVTFTAPAAGGHFTSAPEFSFTIEAGASAVCKTLEGPSGDTSLDDSACTGTYTPHATAPGEYRVRVTSTDAVGNVATAERAFTIDAPPSDTGQQPSQPVPDGQGGTGAPVDAAAILTALGNDLEAAARGLARTKQSKLVRARGRSVTVNALTAGTFRLVFKGAAGKANASRAVTIAKGATVAASAGSHALKLKLTKAGVRLLRRGKRVAGTLTLSFTRPDGSKLSRTRKVTLKRR